MHNFRQSAIALQSQSILGYWGIGQTRFLTTQLNAITALYLTPSIWYSSSAETTEITWQVATNQASSQSNARVELSTTSFTLEPDLFGRSPLYWAQLGQVIWFSSDWRWLLPLLPQATINLAATYGYACFSYVPTPSTPISEVQAIPAGMRHTWTTQTGDRILAPPNSTPAMEWREATPPLDDEQVAIAQLQPLLQAAIQAQIHDLPNDEPVGVFLSGGLDSSIVAALLVQAGLKVRAYTLDFGAAGIPEQPYAAQVAQALQIPLVAVNATPKAIRRAIVPTAQALNLPFGDGVTVPLYLLAEAASQEVRVVFNGEGGDQLFAGWTNKPLIAAGVYQSTQPQTESFAQRYLRTFHRLYGYESMLFQPNILAQIQALEPQQWLFDALDPAACASLLHRLRRATLMLKGAQNIHPRARDLAIAHGLQVRSPFCDLPLTHWAFGLSSELHLHGACEKYILKRAVADWLPSEIVWRTKRGMGVPLTTWCLHELWHDLGVWLNPARLQQEGIWNPHIAQQIAAGWGTIQGRRIGECLWLLLMWQVWRGSLGNVKPGSVEFGNLEFGSVRRTLSLNHPFWLPAPLGKFYCRLQKGIS